MSQQERSSLARRRFEAGIEFYAKGQYGKGWEAFTNAIQMEPLWGNSFAWRGVCSERLKHFQEAVEDYSKSIALDAGLAVSYNNRGLVLRTQFKKHEEALQDFTKCLELEPQLVDARNNRAILYLLRDDLEAAKKDLEQAFKLMPNYANLFATLSMVHLKANEIELAESNARKSLQLDSKSPRGHYVLAKVHQHRREIKEGLQKIQTYLQLDHNDTELVSLAQDLEKDLRKSISDILVPV